MSSDCRVVRPNDLLLAMCELDALYLQHKLSEAFAAMNVADNVRHRVHIRRKILEQDKRVGVISVRPKIFHLSLYFLLTHLDFLVL